MSAQSCGETITKIEVNEPVYQNEEEVTSDLVPQTNFGFQLSGFSASSCGSLYGTLGQQLDG